MAHVQLSASKDNSWVFHVMSLVIRLSDYIHLFTGCLDAVRQKLFKLKAKMNVDNEQHPKVMTLCKEVETWLKKKRAKTKESEQKVLKIF